MATAAQQAAARAAEQREKLVEKWTNIIGTAYEEFHQIVKPGTVSWEAESRFALATIIDGGAAEYLQKATTDSIRSAMVNIAAVGLTINPAMKLAYLVPRDGKCVLDISYIGLIKLATDTHSVAAAKAELVYENDVFEYNGPFEKPLHKLKPFDRKSRGEMVGVYVIAKLHTGFDQIDTLDMEEIEKIKSKSKAKTGPWKEWFEEMVKKAAIKRAYKGWPRTEQLSMAEAILNEHEGNETPIYAGRGTTAAIAAQEDARQNVDQTEMDKVSADLKAAAKQGTEAYKKAWSAITKEQRKALASEHTTNKATAAKADKGEDNGN